MAVALRLARHGRKKRPFYRLIAADSQMPRDGRFLEQLGTLDPLQDPPLISLKEDRVKYWIETGATPSPTFSNVLKKTLPGYLEEIDKKRTEKIVEKRKKRKARAAKK